MSIARDKASHIMTAQNNDFKELAAVHFYERASSFQDGIFMGLHTGSPQQHFHLMKSDPHHTTTIINQFCFTRALYIKVHTPLRNVRTFF